MSRPQGATPIALLVFLRGARARILGIALLLGVAGPVDIQAERLAVQIYDASNGLAHNRIRCVVPDSRGFLWFCTADGLSRFDGSRFVNYGPEQGLPHPTVEKIVEVGPGVYWVATFGGLARLKSDTNPSPELKAAGAPATLPLTAYSLGSDGSANQVLSLKQDRTGRLWIGTAGGLFVLEQPLREPSFRRVEPHLSTGPSALGQVLAFAEGPDGVLWIGTSTGLFRRLVDGQILREQTIRLVEEVRQLLVDRAGRIWIAHGLVVSVAVPARSTAPPNTSPSVQTIPVCRGGPDDPHLPVTAGDICRFETLAGVPAFVRSLSAGSDGRVWVGTSGGLIEFDGDGFRAYSERHGLSNQTINAVSEDVAGNIWVGTDAGGVSKLTMNGFVSFRQEDGLRHNYVTSISQSRAGRVRVGGGWQVVNEFDGQQFTWGRFNLPGQVSWARGYDMLEDHTGDLWVGTVNGLFRFPEVPSVDQLVRARPKAIYSLAHGLPDARMIPAFEDSRGDVWMSAELGSDRRVVQWQRSTNRFHQYPETDSDWVSLGRPAFAEDGTGTVWTGSSRGLARHRDGRFTNISIGDENSGVQVTNLHVDPRGRLWVGTRGSGLYRSDNPEAERPRFVAYTVAGGLSSTTIWCITDDGIGNLYVGTPRGVDRLEPGRDQFKHFSVADGLAGSEVIAAFRDRDSALWFGTFRGISRFTRRPDVGRGPPTVWIGGLSIHGVAARFDPLGLAHFSIRDLEPHQNQIQIDYFGLSAANGELRYQYQLEGTDSTWTAPTAERSVNYAELAPGSYRFLVRAINSDGQASITPASVSFTIVPPVWKRSWFLTMAALLALALGYALHTHRVKRLVEIERLRTRIASDLHDDLGSSLSQISILSEVLRTHLGSPEAHIAGPLSRIGTLSRESVDSMSDIVWAIDPLRDTPIHLIQRMRRVANELLMAAGVQLRFATSGDASPHLNADVRRHVFLIFKEILNNIVRHAEASEVTVEVDVGSRQLQVTVTDNGRGFDTASTEGQGLRSMERRASGVGGSLQVTSHSGWGTRVTFAVPVR
jgi:signal transduction histidine kinase/ligand-binding sensor domain-containing protein